jgi:hypothetical protein
MSPIRE